MAKGNNSQGKDKKKAKAKLPGRRTAKKASEEKVMLLPRPWHRHWEPRPTTSTLARRLAALGTG